MGPDGLSRARALPVLDRRGEQGGDLHPSDGARIAPRAQAPANFGYRFVRPDYLPNIYWRCGRERGSIFINANLPCRYARTDFSNPCGWRLVGPRHARKDFVQADRTRATIAPSRDRPRRYDHRSAVAPQDYHGLQHSHRSRE